MNLKNKKALIFGFGASGKGAAKLLKQKGASVRVYDDKPIELVDGITQVNDLSGAVAAADIVVVSPSVSINNRVLQSAIKEGKEVISELELGYRFCAADMIAITGTNGKTTTTLLVNEILNRAGLTSYALGNIGIALSDKVLDLDYTNTAVVEVSSFQLEGCKSFSPEISAILNITPDHLDRHQNFDAYKNLKGRIFERQEQCDFAVFNADDMAVMQLSSKSRAENLYFSKKMRTRGSYVEKNVIYFENNEKIKICSLNELSLLGNHNLENALAATTICMLKGVNPEIIRMTLKTFTLPDFRMQFVKEKNGIKFFNDSKGTNVAATLAALSATEGKSILILGGLDKSEDFDQLFKALPKDVVHIFVSGANKDKIMCSAAKFGYFNISTRDSLQEIVAETLSFDVQNVVFSPSSASFDKFVDYKERGMAFNSYVEAI